jgi:GTP-binding protein EngB required for normal cell division
MDYQQYIPVVIALIGSAGLWGFLSQKAKLTHEKNMKDGATVAQFNDTLKAQVDSLITKVDKLSEDKEKLLLEMSDMKAALAEANVTIKHFEEMLRAR